MAKTESKRPSMRKKNTDSAVKKKSLVQWLVKKVILIAVFRNMKGFITIDFLEKSATGKLCFQLQNSLDKMNPIH